LNNNTPFKIWRVWVAICTRFSCRQKLWLTTIIALNELSWTLESTQSEFKSAVIAVAFALESWMRQMISSWRFEFTYNLLLLRNYPYRKKNRLYTLGKNISTIVENLLLVYAIRISFQINYHDCCGMFRILWFLFGISWRFYNNLEGFDLNKWFLIYLVLEADHQCTK
jgi:hypothetical protein